MLKRVFFMLALISGPLFLCGCRTEDGAERTGPKGFEKESVPDSVTSTGGDRYAVCIGISDYKNLPSLRFAHRDAEDVYEFLISTPGGYDLDHCILLCDTNAPDGRVLKTQVESLFTTWMARVRPEDSVLVFYSGHGLPFGRDRAFMAAWDTDPEDLYPTAIPMSRIQEYLEEQIASQNVVIVLDTCFSGAVNGKSFLVAGQRLAAFDETNLERVARGRGRVILTASTGRQAAHELAELGHGIFTYCFLEGLRGEANFDRNNEVTLSEMWMYLQREVPREAGQWGLRQTPVRKGDETGEMVLARVTPRPLALEEVADEQAARAAAFILEGTRLMQSGFYARAAKRFEEAIPYLPFESRRQVRELIEECLRSEKAKEAEARIPPAFEKEGKADLEALADTLAEADFKNGLTAEQEGLWDVALAFYTAALEAAPEEQKPRIESRIASCRLEEEALVHYQELEKIFQEAEAQPRQEAYRRALEKAAALEAMGKGEDYRDLGTIRSRCEEEDTSDQSRKYFSFGLRAREEGEWLDAIQWFEKAAEGAGGRYPEAIEKNIIYCRISLEQAVEDRSRKAREAFSRKRFPSCVEECDAWLALAPESAEGEALRLKAAQAYAWALFEQSRFAKCLDFIRQALQRHPGDEVLSNLEELATRENLPEAAREAWEDAKDAEAKGEWRALVKILTAALDAPLHRGFNPYYVDKAETLLSKAKALAYELATEDAQAAMDAEEYDFALRYLREADSYRPDFAPLGKLLEVVEEKAAAMEESLFQSAKETEKKEILDASLMSGREVDGVAILNAGAGYRTYLSRFPDGRWSEDARSALRRLEAKRSRYPDFTGFTFLGTETFSCGGASNRVALYRHDVTGLEFVLVPGGTYLKGSPPWESGRSSGEGPQQQKTIKPFLLCRTECTETAWEAVRVGTPLAKKKTLYPKTRVSWDECMAWCEKTGLRLPTEAEWEYACRAGVAASFCYGDSSDRLVDYAWYERNSGGRIQPVARKKPNAFGLFDMHGNLWEWCLDRYEYPDKEDIGNVRPYREGSVISRVNRGGGWNFPAAYCRSANRSGDLPNTRSGVLGFRPAR